MNHLELKVDNRRLNHPEAIEGTTSLNHPSGTNSTGDQPMNYLELKTTNRRLNYQEAVEGTTRLKSRPLRFWFDINGPCNLECQHCGFRAFGRTSDKEVSQDIYDIVLAELMPTAYTCNLGGTNWGEVTIANRFHEFLLDCKKYEVMINLTTNGTRMNKQWVDDLADTLEVIGFSMEGMEDEFEKIRGFKWRFFLKSVETICKARSDRGRQFRVEWRFCAHSDNIHQLPEMIRVARSVGVDRIQVMNLVPYVPAQKFKNLYFHRSAANRAFAEARKTAADLNFDIEIPPDFMEGTFDTELVQIGEPGKRRFVRTEEFQMANCYLPWQACSINELGIVKPCCVYWRPMGSLAKSGFEAVWNGSKYRRLRSSVNTRPDGICHSCRLSRYDNDQNKSFSQLLPGKREIIRQLTTIRQRRYQFGGVFGGSADPCEKA
jgi:MoaA/NifB/PqqE/SkfB family radical SAM enzyme